MKYFSYLNTAIHLLQDCTGSIPFTVYIKQFFRENKKYGSKDRKAISDLCYSYFRIGKSFYHYNIEERILIGLFLTHTTPNEVLEQFNPGWNKDISLPASKKLKYLQAEDDWRNFFPSIRQVSEEIDAQSLAYSCLQQPELFLRIRPGYKEPVTAKLDGAGETYRFIAEDCIVLPNATKVDSMIELDREAVVQDYNSQQTIAFLQSKISNLTSPFAKLRAWDCCAGSGGKSILLHDIFPAIQLVVSDVRESILQNLHARFKKAGIKNYHSFVADLTEPSIKNSQFPIPNSEFELILLDAPCTGSGTWSRTPEQLSFFDEKKIEHYSNLQKKIAINASRFFQQEGILVYITCSVFTQENEDVVEYIQENTKLQLNAMQYFKGYTSKADTLFAALFTAS